MIVFPATAAPCWILLTPRRRPGVLACLACAPCTCRLMARSCCQPRVSNTSLKGFPLLHLCSLRPHPAAAAANAQLPGWCLTGQCAQVITTAAVLCTMQVSRWLMKQHSWPQSLPRCPCPRRSARPQTCLRRPAWRQCSQKRPSNSWQGIRNVWPAFPGLRQRQSSVAAGTTR